MVADRSLTFSKSVICLLDSKGLQKADLESQSLGFRPELLMEAAGLGIATWILRFLRSLEGISTTPGRAEDISIVILSGPGNNGADGFVVGRYLHNEGYNVQVLRTSFRTKGLNELQRDLAILHGVRVYDTFDEQAQTAVQNAHVLVDCIFGTGTRGSVDDDLKALLSNLPPRAQEVPDRLPFQGTLRISVDFPTGASLFRPHFTLMLGGANIDLYEPQIRPNSGILILISVPFPPKVLEAQRRGWILNWQTLSDPEGLGLGSLRDRFQYKTTRGSLGVIGGSASFPRAPWLTLHAGVRTGVGLLFADVETLGRVPGPSSFIPIPTTSKEGFNEFLKKTPPQVIVLGPGWQLSGKDSNLSVHYQEVLRQVFSLFLDPQYTDRKVLLDAGALRVLASSEELKDYLRQNPRKAGKVLLTPHLGELRAFDPQGTLRATESLVADLGLWILVKYSSLFLIGPNSTLLGWDNPNPIMGFGGSGDILSGLIGGFGARWSTAEWDSVVRTAIPLYFQTGDRLSVEKGFVDGSEFINYLGAAILGRSSE